MDSNRKRTRVPQIRQRTEARAVIGLLLVSMLALAGCGTNAKERSMDMKPPEQLLQDMLDRADTIATLHGGNWTFENGEPWKPDATAGYRGTSCATDPESQQYEQVLLGPAVDDPEAGVANIKDYFTERGFEVKNRFKSEIDQGRYIVFSMINDEGASFVYQPGTHSTGLTVESGCSTDPAMDHVTD